MNLLENSFVINDSYYIQKDELIILDNKCETNYCISCNVKNCVHHTENDTCSAGKIQVGNSSATSVSDTCCDTFKSR